MICHPTGVEGSAVPSRKEAICLRSQTADPSATQLSLLRSG